MGAGVDGQRVSDRVGHRVPAQRVESDRRAGGAVQQRRHELTLVDHPVEIGPRCGAGAHVAERVAAVELLAAGRKVDAGEWVGDRVGRAHRHPADRVDEHREPVETDLGVVVEPDTRRLFDGMGQQRCAAVHERGIDLVGAVVGDLHVRVTRYRHHGRRRARPERGDVHQHDRVGAAVADVAAGGQLVLLFRRQSLPAVGADQQPGGALALHGPVRVVGQRVDSVQLCVDPECGADCTDDGEHQHQEQREDDATPSALASRWPPRRGWRW